MGSQRVRWRIEKKVDRDASDEEIESLERVVIDWLAEARIVERKRSACLLGMDAMGHAPAPQFMIATGEAADSGAVNMNYKGFMTMKVNGLEIIKGRRVSVDPSGSLDCAICTKCRAENPLDEQWSQAGNDWAAGGSGRLACTICGNTQSVAEWDYRDPMGWGTLTFVFWNWPGLGQDFVKEFSRRLGHRVLVVFSHL